MSPRGAIEVILFAERKFAGSLVFTTSTITIGSAPEAMVRLDDPAVSPEHAVIHFTGRTAVIEDHGSAGGVLLGGARIDSHLLQPTDEIAIGRYSLRFVVHHATQPASPQTAVSASAQVVAQVVPPVPTPVPTPVAVPAPAEAQALAAKDVDDSATPLPVPLPAKAQHEVAATLAQDSAARADEDGAIELQPDDAEDDQDQDDDDDDDDRDDDGDANEHHFGHDEDDDEDFVPSFSLLESLQARGAVGAAPKPDDAVAQVIYFRDDFVSHIRHIGRGEGLRVRGGSILQHESPGRLRAQLTAGLSAEVRRRGETEILDRIEGDAGGGATLQLDTTTAATVYLGARETLLVQFVPSSSVPRGALGPARPRRSDAAVVVATLAVHALAFLILGLTPAASTAATEINQGRFAMIEMKDPVLELPKEKPKPKKPEKPKEKPKVKPEVKPLIPPPPMPQLPEALRKFVTRRQPTTPVNPKASSTANKLLSALGNTTAPESSTAVAMTNLNAVPSAEGATGGFRVSGAVGKMEGGLHLAPAGSGTGRIQTRAGNEFNKAGKVVATLTGNVRAKVTKAPPRDVEVQGELDRGEIQKVVNAHIAEISACYERRLIKDPTLAGKVILEWVIVPTGSVGMVRVKFSDVKDIQVSTCIQTSVRLWHFPQPKGGSVTVTYPFVFSTSSI